MATLNDTLTRYHISPPPCNYPQHPMDSMLVTPLRVRNLDIVLVFAFHGSQSLTKPYLSKSVQSFLITNTWRIHELGSMWSGARMTGVEWITVRRNHAHIEVAISYLELSSKYLYSVSGICNIQLTQITGIHICGAGISIPKICFTFRLKATNKIPAIMKKTQTNANITHMLQTKTHQYHY